MILKGQMSFQSAPISIAAMKETCSNSGQIATHGPETSWCRATSCERAVLMAVASWGPSDWKHQREEPVRPEHSRLLSHQLHLQCCLSSAHVHTTSTVYSVTNKLWNFIPLYVQYLSRDHIILQHYLLLLSIPLIISWCQSWQHNTVCIPANKANSALHPSGFAKLSISLNWLRKSWELSLSKLCHCNTVRCHIASIFSSETNCKLLHFT